MAITINNTEITNSISFQDFLEFSKKTIKEKDDDSLLDCDKH